MAVDDLTVVAVETIAAAEIIAAVGVEAAAVDFTGASIIAHTLNHGR